MMILKSLLRMLRPRGILTATNRDFTSSYTESTPVNYETRVVAFLDILGWRQVVDNSANDPQLRMKLLNTVWFFAARAKGYVEEDTVDRPSRDEFSQFSDSLIVSFPYAEARDLYRLLKFVTEFQTSMLIEGLPIRGGVTIGPLFHSDSIAFGPAMNAAYHLESKIANNPRVVVDHVLDNDVTIIDRMKPNHWPFVTKDDDGFFSTDFMTSYAMTKRMARYLDEKIATWLELYRNDAGVTLKYKWLKSRWEAAKADADWRLAIQGKRRAEFNARHASRESKA